MKLPYLAKRACPLLGVFLVASCVFGANKRDDEDTLASKNADVYTFDTNKISQRSTNNDLPPGGLTIGRYCGIVGGDYIIEPDTLRTSCLLPPRTRRLGKPRVYIEPRKILTNAYGFLRPGTEKPDYGLFSYALLPMHSRRSERFLYELLASTGYVIDNMIDLKYLNVVHVPTRDDDFGTLASQLADVSQPSGLVEEISDRYYDYAFARKLLSQICYVPAQRVEGACSGDLSRGPYLFTYVRPLSPSESVHPPYLFVDLSAVHERAFGEFITAFKHQVKVDYTDTKKIDSLRLSLLSIILTAADWTDPIKRSLTEILHVATEQPS